MGDRGRGAREGSPRGWLRRRVEDTGVLGEPPPGLAVAAAVVAALGLPSSASSIVSCVPSLEVPAPLNRSGASLDPAPRPRLMGYLIHANALVPSA